MPDIPAAGITSSYYHVTITLFPSGSHPLIVNAIYHGTSAKAKAQGSYYGGSYISPSAFAGTALVVLPAQNRVGINWATGSGGSSYCSCSISSGL